MPFDDIANRKDYFRSRYMKNKEEMKANAKARYALNPESQKSSNKIRYNANPERFRAERKVYMKANPGKIAALNMKRYASKLNATPKWLTKEQLAEIEWFYTTAKELQWLSEEPLEVDHIIPLQGKNVCGLHVPWNLQILPKSLNISKFNKVLISKNRRD